MQVRDCLRRLKEGVRHKKTGEWVQEDTDGTLVWLEVISWFLRIFFSKKDSLRTRVMLAAAFVSFLRYKRNWIHHDKSYTLNKNAESRQAYQHAVMQAESAALKIQYRSECNAALEQLGRPKVPVCLTKSGSDCCEVKFSQISGYGAVQLNRRNCNVDDALEMCGDLLQLARYEYDPDVQLTFRRANRNIGIDMSDLEDDLDAPDADMYAVLTRKDFHEAGEEGLALMHATVSRVQMDVDRSPPPSWHREPWIDDAAMDGRMRDADAEDDIYALAFEKLEEDQDRSFVPEPEPESTAPAPAPAPASAAPPKKRQARARRKPTAPVAPPRRSTRHATMTEDGDGEDALLARLQAREVHDEVEQAAEQAFLSDSATHADADATPAGVTAADANPDAAPADANPDAATANADSANSNSIDAEAAKISAHVMSPRGLIHKTTFNNHLVTATSKGLGLSAEKSIRAAEAAKQDTDEHSNSAVTHDTLVIGRGSDIAMAFKKDPPQTGYYYQLGRVSRLFNGTTELKRPMVFATRPSNLEVVCGRWYSENAGGSLEYDVDDLHQYEGR